MAKKTAKKKHYRFSISEIIIVVLAILLAVFAVFYPQTTGHATQAYKTISLQHTTLDLRSVGINNANAPVLKISTNTADLIINANLLQPSTSSITTSTVYFYQNNANTLQVVYLNGQTLTSAGTLNLANANEANPSQIITTSSQSTGTAYHLNIYIRDTNIIRTHIESPALSGTGQGNIINIWSSTTTTSFSALGTQTNTAENDEVRWKADGASAIYIGDQNNDYTTPFGIVIKSTRTNAQQDKVIVDLPITSSQSPTACGNQACESGETCEWSAGLNTNILCSNNSRIAPSGMSCSNCILSICGDGTCGALESCEWNGALSRQMLCDGSQSIIPTGGSCASCTYYAPTATTATCTDTDGGIQRLNKGPVSGIDGAGAAYSNTDTCISTATLTEYSCTGTTPTSQAITCNTDNGATCIDGECGYCGNGICNTGETCEFDSVNTRNFDCNNNATITSSQTCTSCVLGTIGGSTGGGSSGNGGSGGSGNSGNTLPPDDGSTGTTLPPQIGEDNFPEDTPSVCGNFIADAGENCANCPQDIQCARNEICAQGTCRTPGQEIPSSEPTNYIPIVVIGLFALVILGGAGAYYYVKKHPKQATQQPPKNMWR